MPRLSPESLEGLRRCLRPEYDGLPREHLEQVLASSVNDMAPDVAEDFMKSLTSLGRAVVPALEHAAPSIIQGAASGASVGGPWGALIGAGTGLASAALSKPSPAPATPTAPAPAVPVAPGAAPAPSLPTGQSAAATVFGLLKNPAVQQALMSQVLGASGTPQVATAAGTAVPRGAVNNLLMQLLANASEGLSEQESAVDESYLKDAGGKYLVDPASFDQRAAVVLSSLQSERLASSAVDSGELFTPAEWMPDESEESWPPGIDQSSESVRFY